MWPSDVAEVRAQNEKHITLMPIATDECERRLKTIGDTKIILLFYKKHPVNLRDAESSVRRSPATAGMEIISTDH